jgi:hypothetical protein
VFVADNQDGIGCDRENVSSSGARIRYVVEVKVVLVGDLHFADWRGNIDSCGLIFEGMRHE